jgi:hypothetical protein
VEVTTISRSPAAAASTERLRAPVDAIIFSRGGLSITARGQQRPLALHANDVEGPQPFDQYAIVRDVVAEDRYLGAPVQHGQSAIPKATPW